MGGFGYGKLRTCRRAAPIQHHSAVYAVALSPDQGRLVTGSSDGRVRLWEKTIANSNATVLPHSRLVYYAAFSPDGKTIATGSADPTVRLWDPTTGKRLGSR